MSLIRKAALKDASVITQRNEEYFHEVAIFVSLNLHNNQSG